MLLIVCLLYEIRFVSLWYNFKSYIMKITKKEIKEFLKEWADEVYDMPDDALELLMDDHICISWYGKEYFLQENNSFRSDFENDVY